MPLKLVTVIHDDINVFILGVKGSDLYFMVFFII